MTQNNHISKTLTAIVTGLILSVASIQLVSAATEPVSKDSIAISPTNKTYNLDAGSKIEDSVTIINAGNQTSTFKMYAEPYSVKNDSYEPDFYTVKKNTDFNKWVKFSNTSYTVKPGESVKATYTIAVPANATPGGHYGVIFAEAEPAQTGSIERTKRVGSLVYATVKGEYTMGGTFNNISTAILQFKPPLRSELDVENTGNSHFTVDTVFAVSDILGNRKYTETKEYRVLPQSLRKIPLSWDKSPGFGLYKVTTSAKFLDKETTKTSLVLMAPIAYYMIFVVALLVAVIVFVAKRR